MHKIRQYPLSISPLNDLTSSSTMTEEENKLSSESIFFWQLSEVTKINAALESTTVNKIMQNQEGKPFIAKLCEMVTLGIKV